ncbi:cytochrome-c peroxidase [Mucilaginibacter hurinus]|uniref:Cytochrome-c peroxidase n=1 Tax=Mucilaginibacter hurinus TaxID=2201324 RepID=A0A367GT63_9SPHI|nr:cytochrome c peroxidase [Mucilaginibacter hurinus]RCH55981.1 cytochrome-c peroxidase [Mucilaginibacter hurinus]
MWRLWLMALGLGFLLVSCRKNVDEPQPPADDFAGFVKPANFPAPVYKLENNQVTKAGFELGRALFYDPALSRNNTISCGSCHIQGSAFTQHGHDVSHGIDDRLGTRNSPAIMNLAWMPSFFWDGGVFDLDLQPVVPITNHVEMDETVENVIRKLQGMPKYRDLFKKAYNSEEITTARLMKALSQFMIMCVSANSKYDKVKRNEAGETFTPEEQAGYALFKQMCADCHTEPLFTDNSFRNNGIGIGFNNDEGRAMITFKPDDKYRFKVPSLRNLKYTAPYMHDGRILNLNGVLNHYAAGVKQTPNLDPLLQKNGGLGLPLTETGKQQIIAFLNTLNDTDFINNRLLAEQ